MMLKINQPFFAELMPETAANINGGQGEEDTQLQKVGQSVKSGFNYSRYLQALGIAYLSPPEIGNITDKEALLSQYQGWED